MLILGETGTGKDVLARHIHSISPRKNMATIDCAALSPTLAHSELFGHVRGSYTGASENRIGLLEGAHRGTLFLDELGDMQPDMQTLLLRALEAKEVRRVGGSSIVPLDVRVISATHSPHLIRPDVYQRISEYIITIPPLRHRRADIHTLTHTLSNNAPITRAALKDLQAHTWPGNVRELRNVIRRAIVLCEGKVIDSQHIIMYLPPTTPTPAHTYQAVEEAERQTIMGALGRVGWNQSRAAKDLGIARGTLSSRMTRYGISRPQHSSDASS